MINYKKLNVLVLDDEKIFTDIISLMLVDMGVGSIKVFNDSKDAMDSLKTFTPNVIISDIEMGEKNGFQFIQEARNEYPDTGHASIVFLTGHAEPEFIQQAKGLRVSGYLLKPLHKDKLKALLGKIHNTLLSGGRL